MTTIRDITPEFDVDDFDLLDLAGAVQVDRARLIALVEAAHADKSRPAAPGVPWVVARAPRRQVPGDQPVVELRRPLHLLADLLTMREHADRPLNDVAVCYVGDGTSDLATSLLLAGALLGMDVRIAAPYDRWPAEETITAAQDLAAGSGARLLITPDAGHAVLGADFVVAGPWADGAVVTGAGSPYAVTEEFLDTSGVPPTATLPDSLDDASTAPEAPPRSLHIAQTLNRRFVLDAVLADWLSA